MGKIIDKSSVKDIIELSDIQKGILFHYLENNHSNYYNVQIIFEISGELDIEKFKKSFEILQGNHEVLRSVFRWEKLSIPLQIVLKSCPLDIFYIDISNRDDEKNKVFLDNLFENDRKERFDLSELPIKIKILKIAKDSYLFSLSYHHILFDGWSNGVFIRDLFNCYRTLLSNENPTLNNRLSIKEIQKRSCENIFPEKGNQYWSNYLSDYEITLPFSNNQSAEISLQKYSVRFPIDDLKSYSRKHNITLASIIYTAYGLLLQKKSNTSDIVFGTTVATRNSKIPGIEDVIGNFINTIPLRMTNPKGKSLNRLILDVHSDLINRNEFNNISYASIKKSLKLKPNESLYDSIIVIENYPIQKDIVKDIKNFEIKLNSFYENINIPLLLTVFVQNELVIEFTFNENDFKVPYIEDFAKQLINIISAIPDNSDYNLDEISYFSNGEKDLILNEFNKTSKPIPEKKTLIDLLEEQAEKTPNSYAIFDGESTLTFKDLNAKSNQLACELINCGVRNEEVIGIMVDRRIEMIISIIAVLKTGAAFLPIDPDYPILRIRYMLEDTKVRLLLTESSLSNIYEQFDSNINCLNVLSQELYNGHLSENIKLKIAPTNLAYIIYTSGSTGKPKGIMAEHLNVINYLQGVLEWIDTKEVTTILCLSTISFDVFVTETLFPLLNGLKIVLANSTIQKDPNALSDFIIENNVDCLQVTPSHLKLLLMGADSSFFHGIKLIMIGAEPLTYELLTKLRERYNGKVYNMYGTTETTVWSTFRDLTDSASIDIGKPICNTSIYILDKQNCVQPIGLQGELCIGGLGLARGYWNNDKLTKERFIENPYKQNERLYKTGDLAYWLPDGNIKLLGRIDNQVKIRGFRIELGEIESQLLKYEEIIESLINVKEIQNEKVLVAYYVSKNDIDIPDLKNHLSDILTDYMVPSYFVRLKDIPLLPNGKINRKLLPEPELEKKNGYVAPSNEVEDSLVKIWSKLLGHKNIGVQENYFDLGADSLKLIDASNKIKKEFNTEITINDLFSYPTIHGLAKYIRKDNNLPENKNIEVIHKNSEIELSQDIAVVGISGRFPGASNVDLFWEKLKNGENLITRKEYDKNSSLVIAKGILADHDVFDGSFFNYTPSEAESMDPQIRIFHECVYEALEDSGYNPYKYDGRIGLYAGSSLNPFYNVNNADMRREDWVEKWEQSSFLYKDFLCSRISYKLDLKGPSISINTACSTSLVAVDKACSDLLLGKADIAIAGGVSVTFHDNNGYFYQKDMILSPDGKCNAFDEKSAGTVPGNGAGVVVLKRLNKALEDNDNIHAIIKSTATNNDGNDKVGYTAPSINGQSDAIKAAIESARVPIESITYIESHGTGTKLGDPVEIAALTKAYNTSEKQYCAIGSVKSNIGHLDAAAGIAGLIKTILSLKNKQIPPSPYFNKPNPNIDFVNSPFYINNKLVNWENKKFPRRAGISSFGIGGTNAHAILEEAPIQEKTSKSREYQILQVSARSLSSLHENTVKLKNYLSTHNDTNLADIAYTLKVGRQDLEYRKVIVCKNSLDAIEQLNSKTQKIIIPKKGSKKQIVFMFPGQGSQYTNMCHDLYLNEPFFRNMVDKCFKIYYDIVGTDLKSIIFPDNNSSELLHEIDEIYNTHPSLFIIEYALAKLLMHWGIQPDYMIGHSIGEYVAACISGVFSLKEAIFLVIKRSSLIHKAKEGKMLGISISEREINEILKSNQEISLSVVNSPEICVVSGEEDSINNLQRKLKENGYQYGLIQTYRASHSHMMDGILKEFEKEIAKVNIKSQSIPFASNVTGKLFNNQDLKTTQYWVDHLRQTVRFSDGIETLAEKGESIFVEVGPGNVLGSFVRSNRNISKGHKVVFSVRHKQREDHDLRQLLTGLGKLWANGCEPNWRNFYENEKRRRISLPTYSFDKSKYPVNINSFGSLSYTAPNERLIESPNINDWFHAPSWEISSCSLSSRSINEETCYLLILDECGVGLELYNHFLKKRENVFIVKQGEAYNESRENHFEINLGNEGDYYKIFSEIGERESLKIIFAWGISYGGEKSLSGATVKRKLEKYFYSLLNISKVIGSKNISNIEIVSITNYAHYILEEDIIEAEKSTILGALKVIQKEYSNISCRNIDIEVPNTIDSEFIVTLLKEIDSNSKQSVVAYRHKTRFIETFKPINLTTKNNEDIPFKSNGIYLITGGVGGIGLSVAKGILKDAKEAKLILLGRKELPGKEQWRSLLDEKEQRESELYKIIKELQEIEDKGGIVHYISADIADEKTLKLEILRIQEEIGKITGVIHAAGIADYAGIIYNRTKEQNEKVLSAKIYGTILLDKILCENKLEFFVLCSSISATIPVEGQVGYVVANMFLNSYSRYRNTQNKNYMMSIGWNTWRDVGFAAKFHENDKNYLFYNSISPDEGYEVLVQTLQNRIPEFIISKINISDLVDFTNCKNEHLSETITQPGALKENISGFSIAIVRELMQDLWQKYLGLSEIDSNDDFFEIGGNSLKALTLIGRIQKALNVAITIKDFFNNPTVHLLSEHVMVLINENKGIGIPQSIPKAELKEYYPITEPQKAMIIAHQMAPNRTTYNITNVIELDGEVELAFIQSIIDKMVKRHEILRTYFKHVDNDYVQIVDDDIEIKVESIYIEENQILNHLKSFIKPFNVMAAPLFRVCLVNTKKRNSFVLIDFHHIIIDGVSVPIFKREFLSLYGKQKLPNLNCQYKDYAQWSKIRLEVKEYDKQYKFWLEQFKHYSHIPIVRENKNSAIEEKGKLFSFKIEGEELDEIEDTVKKLGITKYTFLLTTYALFINKCTYVSNIVIGTPFANRKTTEEQNLIGMFVNLLPVLIQVDSSLKISELFEHLQKKIIDLSSNSELPFGLIQKKLKDNNIIKRAESVVQTVFSLQNQFDKNDYKESDLTKLVHSHVLNTPKYPITLDALETKDNILFWFLSAEEVEKIIPVHKYKAFINIVVKNIDKKIGEIDLEPSKVRVTSKIIHEEDGFCFF